MHHGRFGGNARKRKAKLTDATFHKMIGAAPVAEGPVATLPVADPAGEDREIEDAELRSGMVLNLLRPARMAPRARPFDSKDFQFGYKACLNCRNEQAYYLHQEDLAVGFTFRCRVCRMEMTVSLDAGA
ncbi:MAG TPA: hypothetical protein VN837_06335 [Chloroflexota bacterium]|nr:hypothetical protein [Chloroflexota bacterium]